MGKSKYPQVKILWIDAESHDEWTPIDDLDTKCKEIVTFGHLIRDDDNGLVVAQNLDAENNVVSMTMCLPNHWIISVEYLD